MRKNGFTLIELLAVIVILAIIALIATPIVLNIIEDTKKSAQLRGAEFYLDAVEQAIMRKNMSSVGMFKPNTCTVKEDGNLDCEGYADPIEVEVSGEVPEKGSIITIKDGKIDEITLKYGTDTIIKKDGKLDYEDTKSSVTYANGEEVYFDVTAGKSCTNYHEDNSKTGYNGYTNKDSENVETQKLETQNGCLKFYAFLDEGNDTVNLILDHNTTAKIAWNLSNINALGPLEVINQLYEDTKEWKGTLTPSDYKMDQTGQSSGANYEIKYGETPTGKTEAYKARLITAQEIAKITGADKENTLNWKEESSTSEYYLDGAKTNDTVPNWQTQIANSTNPSVYYWLFDRTYDCISYGCKVSDNSNYGYWTSSSYADYFWYAWRVCYYGSVYNNDVGDGGTVGLRPVITVLKSNIKKS